MTAPTSRTFFSRTLLPKIGIITAILSLAHASAPLQRPYVNSHDCEISSRSDDCSNYLVENIARFENLQATFQKSTLLCEQREIDTACHISREIREIIESDEEAIPIDSRTIGSLVNLSENLLRSRSNGTKNRKEKRHCRKILEIQATVVCVFPSQESLNLSLQRFAHFAEQDRRVISSRELRTQAKNSRWIGHNLRMLDLQSVVSTMTSHGEPLLSEEEQVLADIYRELGDSGRENGVVLGVLPTSVLNGNLVHELLHAAYFQDVRFRKGVDDFWNSEMSLSEREEISQALRKRYRAADEYILKNEFQAHYLDLEFQAAIMEKPRIYSEILLSFLISRDALPSFLLEKPLCSWHQQVRYDRGRSPALSCAKSASNR